jgi:hypothetical protein
MSAIRGMSIRVLLVAACTGIATLASCGILAARPFNKPSLSCGFYDRLDAYCGCRGADGYLIGYGRRYCDRFLNSSGWTPAGTKWRDETLICLQKSLARTVLQGPPGACDCAKTRDIAWQTHISCYTQPSASVCDLPLSDLTRIYRIIDAADLLSPDGFSQALAIASICMRHDR